MPFILKKIAYLQQYKNRIMKVKALALGVIIQLLCLTQIYAQVLLNEIKVNPPGNDNPFEFIELKGTPGSTINNVYLVILEGDSGNTGVADLAIKLNQITFGSNGLYFIGTSLGYTISLPTLMLDTLIFGVPGGVLENGSSTFMLVNSPSPIIYGIDYDTDNNGVLELPAGAIVLDSFGWVSGSASNAILYSPAVLTQSNGTPDAAVRFYGNNTPISTAAWYCGDLTGTGSTGTFDPLRVSFNFPTGGALSPGDHNLPNTLAIPVISSNLNITVFPNPASNSIQLSGIIKPGTYQIFDITGKHIQSGTFSTQQLEINIQELNNGLYVIKIIQDASLDCLKFEISK